MRDLYNNLVSKHHRKRSLGRHKNRWENNVSMDVAKHSVKVQPAFNHLKIIQLLNFMNTVTNK
jgi:hypothetical protein